MTSNQIAQKLRLVHAALGAKAAILRASPEAPDTAERLDRLTEAQASVTDALELVREISHLEQRAK